jgi:hypothetical protein
MTITDGCTSRRNLSMHKLRVAGLRLWRMVLTGSSKAEYQHRD